MAIKDSEIGNKVAELFDMRPAAIVKRFGLKNPIFNITAAYGHMGRDVGTITVDGKEYETFTWEKLDMVDAVKASFGL